jgi:predicted alpha/beta hydrolase family esterase
MKAIIFHGTDCKPDDTTYWYSWLRSQLESSGYEVETPYYTDINHEPINTFLPKVLQAHTFDEDTVLVGHSSGATLILNILENVEAIISQAILVAGFSQELPGDKNPILQDSYDWEKIKSHVKDIYLINSVDDPWGCDDKQGRIMFDKLGGTQIIRNEGHFGSASKNQPYPEFPLLKEIILARRDASVLKDLQRKALVVLNHYDDYNRAKGRKTWDLNDYVDGMVGDVGDLMKAVMGARKRRDFVDADAKVEHELNDIMWSLLVLYKIFRIDVDKSFVEAMGILEKRIVKMKVELKMQNHV